MVSISTDISRVQLVPVPDELPEHVHRGGEREVEKDELEGVVFELR